MILGIPNNVFLNSWLLISLVVSFLNIFVIRSNKLNGYALLILFVCVALTSTSYNSDIENYYMVYKGMNVYNPIAWNYEPGFNFILYATNKISNGSDFGFFLVRFFPGVLLYFAIRRNKYHSSFVPFYLCCLGLVLSSTTLRASYAFSFLTLLITFDSVRFTIVKILSLTLPVFSHFSSFPIALMHFFRKSSRSRRIVILFLTLLLLSVVYPILSAMTEIIFAKVVDRGATWRVGIPIRAIQFVSISFILFILFKKNGIYLINYFGKPMFVIIFVILILSAVNYGLSRLLLYCYPILFVKNNKFSESRSLNQIICLISLPSAVYFYIEFDR